MTPAEELRRIRRDTDRFAELARLLGIIQTLANEATYGTAAAVERLALIAELAADAHAVLTTRGMA